MPNAYRYPVTDGIDAVSTDDEVNTDERTIDAYKKQMYREEVIVDPEPRRWDGIFSTHDRRQDLQNRRHKQPLSTKYLTDAAKDVTRAQIPASVVGWRARLSCAPRSLICTLSPVSAV
jgi:hypothetical protein